MTTRRLVGMWEEDGLDRMRYENNISSESLDFAFSKNCVELVGQVEMRFDWFRSKTSFS